MARGPAPKPTALRIIDGSRLPQIADEPQPDGTIPDAPPDLSPAEAAVWRETLTAAPAGLLRRLDLSCFTIFVKAVVLHAEASRHVAEKGSIILTRDGNIIQNPYLAVMNKQALIALKAGDQMGFSPSARTRISVGANGTPQTPTGNPFARNGVRPPRA